jgi:hypothetical protein
MTATTYTVLDSAGNTKTFQAEDVGATGQLSSKVTVRESALPTGAATEATLLLIESAVDGIEALLGGTLAISAASLPLPTGAATSAKQPAIGTAGTASADVLTVQGIASMTALKVDGSAVTQPVSDGGGSLTVDGTVAVSGTVTVDTELTTANLDTGVGTDTRAVVGLAMAESGGATLVGSANPLPTSVASLPLPAGAATEATLLLVEGAVDGIEALLSGTLAVSAVSLPLPTGAATEATLASALTALQLIDNIVSGTGVNISKINGVTPLMGAGNTGTGTLRVDLTSNGSGQVAAIGKANHDSAVSGAPVLNGGYASATAPANVSANGDVVRAWHLLNGAQATVLTAAGALIGGDATNGLDVDVTRLPALPAGTNNIGDVDVLSLPALPSGTNNIGDVDVASLPTTTSGGPANVGSSATNVTLLASNAARKGASIMNDSTEVLYVKFGATASATSFHVKMAAGSYLEVPFGYTGIIDGIWASANGNARVGEFT